MLGNEESQRAADGPDLAAGRLGPAARPALPPPRRLLRPAGRVRLEPRRPAVLHARHRDRRRARRVAPRRRADGAAAVRVRRGARHRLGRRAGHRPAPVPGRARAAQRRRRARRDRGRAGPEHRRGPPPPRRRRAPPARVLPAHRPQLGGGDARRRLRRHPRGARLPEGDGVPRRPPRRPPRADCRASASRPSRSRASRAFPLEVLPPLLDAAFVRHGCVVMDAGGGRAPHAARHPRHLLVGQQRARAAAPGSTTGSSCRCTTATAGSPAWCGSTTPRTASCPPTSRCRRCGRSRTRR